MRLFIKTLLGAALSASLAVSAQTLPQIKILATGGTIAGTAASATQTTGYKAGDLGIQVLIEAVPQMKEFADVSGEQIFKISSNNMTDEGLLKLAKRCNELLKDPKVSGIVITHGTDTLEETAYFLNLTVKSKKPVVLVGAMRPATAISADGPMNLLNAVRVAADPQSVGKGVLITMNDVINNARDVTQTNPTNGATFRGGELGALGYIAGGKNYFYKESTRPHTYKSDFDIEKINKLPRVDIIYSHVNADRVLVDAAVAAGAKGIVAAGTGNGSISEREEAGLVDAMKKFSKIYITFDIDGLDPAYAAGTGTPQFGGLTARMALTLLEKLFAGLNVIGFDVVEIAPSLDPSLAAMFAGRKLIQEVWGYWADAIGKLDKDIRRR